MGRHELARKRRKSPALTAAAIASGAVFFAVGGSAYPHAATKAAEPVVTDDTAACCAQLVSATPRGTVATQFGQPGMGPDPDQAMPASRWRVVTHEAPRLLPVGVASESGLQVKTILAARSISAAFPEIHQIGGVRPDALRWHPNGLALDVMIPNPSSAEGIALGNEIVAFALKNTERFDLQDAIWRGTYYTPNGPQGSGYGHYDHVHITTHGGGYPTGGEVYVR
ncbi:hypothetical protein [Mycobacterium talmoniae]|uniref:ARB-07466-like C-terminal domain-containing protein n=1 Tax=Mycobacterium talmoniae TaxID=1858794 RepID=A0A1S1NBT8_9MYCO|nr:MULTISPECIES: hypothetical protein [Mycobacterium]OHU96884.1 hypothetical protein BKN37_22580 [Mycobacterium talmoniae]TDH47205.1 hypothetical protein E2F47_26740 [Mycobacterium eburneum]